ncbi:MAG: nitrous oxide reductase accessory protein NosL [Deltaproteobacteria bacterium]|nr:nitrous oxide reductase accessory protein NosL [Deltaproteobacteria bacterium]
MRHQKAGISIVTYLIAAILVLILSSAGFAAGPKPMTPAARDKCPVCGMFVAKYPDFAAQIHFRDGSSVFFDGVKDMLKYYRNITRYASGRKLADVSAMYVTDYYSLGQIDGYKAYYVSGSDVFGPMGKELVPFEKKADALEFMKDHNGRAILGFREVNAAVMKSLD